jgi:ABC-type multidrug transport system fused ATPase/permease subunit
MGCILIDGVNIKDYDIHHLRKYFGVVSQEPTLFDESVKFNIIYNKETASENELNIASNILNI